MEAIVLGLTMCFGLLWIVRQDAKRSSLQDTIQMMDTVISEKIE